MPFYPDSIMELRIHVNLKPTFHYDAKPFALGPRVGLDPQRHNFVLGIPTCWYLKWLKFELPPTQMLKFVLPPTPTPNTSRWNIASVRSPKQNSRVGHVDFMLFVSLSLSLGSQREHNFQWNMGFKVWGPRYKYSLT